jgi:hypothetical protein
LLVGSLITEVGGQIGWLATGMEFRFLRPVYFGETITSRFALVEVDERGRAQGRAVVSNQHGTIVVEATLAGRLPGEAERAVLAAMVAEGDPTNKVGSIVAAGPKPADSALGDAHVRDEFHREAGWLGRTCSVVSQAA